MSIINTASGGEPIPDFGWVELSVTQSATYSLSIREGSGSVDVNNVEISIPSDRDGDIYMYLYSDITNNGGSTWLYGDRNIFWPSKNWSALRPGAFWVRSKFGNEAYWATDATLGYRGPVYSPTLLGYVYYSKKATIVTATAPVVGNIPIKIHLTEHTGNQYKRLPIMG